MDKSLSRRRFVQAMVPLAGGLALPARAADRPSGPSPGKGRGFTLWQLPNQTRTQMMSYMIRTSGGKILVIDGGNVGDAPYLRGFLAALGNKVDAWFISHAHDDHFDALRVILDKPADLQIGPIYASLPTESWVKQHEAANLKKFEMFNAAVRKAGQQIIELKPGQVLKFDGVPMEVLGVKNLEITTNAVNNSSFVIRVTGKTGAILFTGDLGVEGGRKLMNSPHRKQLQADYIQMAHHGQNGVDEDFYREVQPKYCFWPTPSWLWNNDNGGGKGSGPWQTLEVRAWMKKLNVKRHFVGAEGLHRVEI